MRGATAVTDNAQLVKKVRFPAAVLVLAVILTGLLHEAIAGFVFSLVLLGIGELSWTTLPWLLVVLPIQLALTTGLGLFFATVTVYFRDTRTGFITATGWSWRPSMVRKTPQGHARLIFAELFGREPR